MSVSPGQGVCAFCARKRALGEAAGRRRWALGVAALAALLAVGGGVGLWRTKLLRPRQLEAPPTLPSAEPVIPPPMLEVTESHISLNGTKLLDLPALDEQARDGAGAQHKVQDELKMEIIPLRDALLRLGSLPPTARERLHIKLSVSTPYRLFFEVLFSSHRGNFSRYRLSLPPSPTSPAITLDTEARTPHGNDERADLQWLFAHVHAYDVDLDAISKQRREHIGFGCVAGGLGLSVHLREAADYAKLEQCLRGRSDFAAPHTGTTATITADNDTPTGMVLQVASVLRCGQRSCPLSFDQPPLYDGLSFSVPRKPPEPPEDAKERIAALRPLLRSCYQQLLGVRADAGGFRARLLFRVRPDGQSHVSVDPGLPAELEKCITTEVERARPRFARSPNGAVYAVPITFKPQ